MAYSAIVTIQQKGSREFEVRIEEFDCGPLDVATVDVLTAALGPGIPIVGDVLRQMVVRVSGSATTVNGILSETPDPFTDQDRVICENDPNIQPIPHINDTQGVASYFDASPSPLGPWGRAFHRSRPNLGNDNHIISIYRIRPGW